MKRKIKIAHISTICFFSICVLGYSSEKEFIDKIRNIIEHLTPNEGVYINAEYGFSMDYQDKEIKDMNFRRKAEIFFLNNKIKCVYDTGDEYYIDINNKEINSYTPSEKWIRRQKIEGHKVYDYLPNFCRDGLMPWLFLEIKLKLNSEDPDARYTCNPKDRVYTVSERKVQVDTIYDCGKDAASKSHYIIEFKKYEGKNVIYRYYLENEYIKNKGSCKIRATSDRKFLDWKNYGWVMLPQSMREVSARTEYENEKQARGETNYTREDYFKIIEV
ncbi:MAG: hypothetical protein NZM04_08060, partial [Methylacidiphilales bacterium]|nr:hypothetical protein [Candidatus Methylacidiphilales bacterium]